MKKWFLFTAFLWVTTFVFAQKSRLEFGIESGVNVSKIQKYEWLNTEVPLQSPTWLSGSQVALSLRYRISERWRLKTEFGGIQKGWKGQRGSYGFCGTGATEAQLLANYQKYQKELSTPLSNDLVYTSIPLLAEYSFWQQKVYVQFGGYWAYQNYLEAMAANDFGGSIGLGAKFKLFKWLRLNFETRYSQGFSKVFRETATISYGNYSYAYPVEEKGWGNQTLAINMGLFFSWH